MDAKPLLAAAILGLFLMMTGKAEANHFTGLVANQTLESVIQNPDCDARQGTITNLPKEILPGRSDNLKASGDVTGAFGIDGSCFYRIHAGGKETGSLYISWWSRPMGSNSCKAVTKGPYEVNEGKGIDCYGMGSDINLPISIKRKN